jgi:hypothetical protein
LKLADGTSLKGYLGTHVDLDPWKANLGLEVVVEGTVAFRPIGPAAARRRRSRGPCDRA